MLRPRLAAFALLLAGLSGCESSVAEVELGEESPLTGIFSGSFRSVGEEITLVGNLRLELTESASGELFGGFTLEAALDDGEFQLPIAGTGPLIGSVSPASVAAMSFTATPDFCPYHTVHFSGSYDRRSGALVVGGVIDILDPMCAVQLSFPSTIPMRR
jgi:hypothetical protein